MTVKDPRPQLVVLGTGGHAKVVIEILEAMERFEIVGCCSDDPAAPDVVAGHAFRGGFDGLSDLLQSGVELAAVGVGGWTDNTFRREVFDRAKGVGFELVCPIHPTAIVASNVSLGEGTMVGSGAVVMTEAQIGSNVIVSSSCLIGHETLIEDDVLVSGAVRVGADVTVRRDAILAFGSTILSRTVIGESSLVASGAVVVEDVPPRSRVFGVPARPRPTGS